MAYGKKHRYEICWIPNNPDHPGEGDHGALRVVESYPTKSEARKQLRRRINECPRTTHVLYDNVRRTETF